MMALLKHALNSSLTMVHPFFSAELREAVRPVKILIAISMFTQGRWTKVREEDDCRGKMIVVWQSPLVDFG